tara:strand:- start:51849 stop:51998 length:150 start_codon:yes stop_codon:yes gene_type:complete
MYAIKTHAAACTPPPSSKVSKLKPKRKARIINNDCGELNGYKIKNKMYK